MAILDELTEQEVSKNKAIRGYIVRALAKGSQNALLVRQITNALVADGLIYSPDISKPIEYLQEAGYPRCGEIVCGVWPHIVSEGHLVASTVMAQGGASGGGNPFPRAGTFAASEEFYHFGAYTIYQGFASDIEVGSKAAQGAKVYLRCSTSTRCSTNAKGGAAE